MLPAAVEKPVPKIFTEDESDLRTLRCISAKRTRNITCWVPPTLIKFDTRSGAYRSARSRARVRRAELETTPESTIPSLAVRTSMFSPGRIWDKRSLNSAAERAGVPMIATELGGGGGVDPSITNTTEAGLYRLLRYLKILMRNQTSFEPNKVHKVEIRSQEHSVFSEGNGIFDRKVSAGVPIKAGQIAGYLHYSTDPKRHSETIVFPHNGFVLAHTNRGYVSRGDMLMLVVQDADNDVIS